MDLEIIGVLFRAAEAAPRQTFTFVHISGMSTGNYARFRRAGIGLAIPKLLVEYLLG